MDAFLTSLPLFPSHPNQPTTRSPSLAVELLVLADEYMLDHLKQLCEARLTVRHLVVGRPPA